MSGGLLSGGGVGRTQGVPTVTMYQYSIKGPSLPPALLTPVGCLRPE